jgi:hypothetical protein
MPYVITNLKNKVFMVVVVVMMMMIMMMMMIIIIIIIILTHGATAPTGPRPPHCQGFMITIRHTTFGRTPLDG